MAEKRRHRRKNKSLSRRKRSFEQFLSSFKIIGIIFFLIGMYFLISSSETFNGLKEIIINFFIPSDSNIIIASENGNPNALLLYFLPVIFILGVILFFAKRFSLITYPLSLISSIYLIVIQWLIVVYFPHVTSIKNYYPSIFIADVFLLITVCLLLINAILHKKPSLIILTIIYFYWSILLLVFSLTVNITWQLEYLIPFIVLLSIAVVWSARRIKQPLSILLNFLFAIGFFGLFWLKKFVINARPEFLTEFFIYGALLYVLFYAIIIFVSDVKEKPFHKWMQGTMAGLNLLFYGGTTAYVILKYYSFGYLWMLVLALLLFNLIGLHLLKRYKFSGWELPHQIAVLLLAAFILPLLFHQSMMLLFTAGISVMLLLFANYSKNYSFILYSMAAICIMTIFYLVQWWISYIPALILKNSLPEDLLIINGILTGIIVVAALAVNQGLLKNMEIYLPHKWFSKSKNLHVLRGLFLFTLFLAVSWIGITLLCRLTGSMENVPTSWFISSCIYFICMISFFSGQESIFKKPVHLIAFIFAFSYPLLVHLPMTGFRTALLKSGVLVPQDFVIHYLALALLIVLGAMVIPRVLGWFTKNNQIRQGLQLLIVLFLFFLATSEYDNISVLLTYKQNTTTDINILVFNLHLPYSIILIISSVLILIWATVKHHRFIRTITIILLLAAIVKIFVYDFAVLDDTARTFLFIFLGLLFIAFSVYYPKLLKSVSQSQQLHHHHSSGRHKLTPSEDAPAASTTPEK